MSEESVCPNCVHSETCQTVYQRLGEQSGASVAPAAFGAFVLPLIIFIVSLAAGQKVLSIFLQNRTVVILAALLLALSISFAAVLLTRNLFHSENEDNTACKLKGE